MARQEWQCYGNFNTRSWLKKINRNGFHRVVNGRYIQGAAKTFNIHSVIYNEFYIWGTVLSVRIYIYGKKDTSSYETLFENLVSLWPPNTASKVKRVMTDYEAAVRKAVRLYFTNARISGCYFHFVKVRCFRKNHIFIYIYYGSNLIHHINSGP